MAELLPALSQRRARRAFASTPISTEAEALLWRAVSVAPSHGNTQPTRLLIARTSATRAALVDALSPGNRQWAAAAPLLLALAALPKHDAPQPNSDGSVRELWAFNAGIAAGNLMAQATALGLIAHPMAGFDEVAVRAVFGVPPEVRLLAVFALGYPGTAESLPEDLRARETATQDRLPTENLVAEDCWTPSLELSARDFRRQQARS
ncbi:MAG: nitroreductase family protein [Anaerolineaceae bacterium]